MHHNKLVGLFTFLAAIQSSLGRSIPFEDDLYSLLDVRESSELSTPLNNGFSPLLEVRMLKRPASGSESPPPRTRPPPGTSRDDAATSGTPAPGGQPGASTPGASTPAANAPPASGQQPAAPAPPGPRPASPPRSNTMPPLGGQPRASTPGAPTSEANTPPAPKAGQPPRSNTMPPSGQPAPSTPGASTSGTNAPQGGADSLPYIHQMNMQKDHGQTSKDNPGATQYSATVKNPPGGANNALLNNVAKKGAGQMKEAHGTADGRPGNVAAIRFDDRIQVASSQTGVSSSNNPNNANLHPNLQGVIDDLDSQGAFNGAKYGVPGRNAGVHSEIHAVNNQVHQMNGQLPTGGQSVAHNVQFGSTVGACKSCSPVLTKLGIDHVKGTQRRSIGVLQLRIAEALKEEDLDHYVPRNVYSDRLYAPLYIRSRL